MIVTGEASGDLHGANLIQATREIDPDIVFFGVGGCRMAAEGCEILIPGESLSVMGLAEVFGHFSTIYRAYRKLKHILSGPARPDVLVLLDFPEFNLRLARAASRVGVPVLYYISPQVWAWRRGRVKKIARVVDRLAVIFPFEPELYAGENVEVDYVGNPLLDEIRITRARDSFLREHGLDPSREVVGIFPGSRRQELKYNLDVMISAAKIIHSRRPDLQFLLPVASSLKPAEMRDRLAEIQLPIFLVDDNIYDAIQACEAILTVSGTVTLQIGLIGTPMAILYKMAPFTYFVGKRLIKVPHIGLANIVAGEAVAREFIQHQATPENLADELLRLLEDQEYRRKTLEGLSRIPRKMGERGCSRRVARMVSEMCGRESQDR